LSVTVRFALWVLPPLTAAIASLHGEVLGQACDEHLRAGHGLAAIEAARRLVDADPDNEAAHARLMVAYARSGRRGSALRQYLACRRVLVAEFGVEPAAETRDLHERILAGTAV
jgi:DNA-binding SARP family transcriptional activator